ncbi:MULTISPECIES: TonB-dependent siderophore receptor [unclassified Janthinobacterium]|uniref:TonB-dependent receptor n=1 Tax=unclassified Janthinobacterium TaxID=2610881 RepID=UPI00161B898D|nr:MULTISPECIES: TonB-dependent receptor [unclassified Janthinobacterium]MBB5607796.1 iron complex outermembrane receptor protein [Janthinobacterium sp. S3T4]MBB5613055.1 iron complex outermembrane receptor protein [Janthinobacterium sp. S3M3]
MNRQIYKAAALAMMSAGTVWAQESAPQPLTVVEVPGTRDSSVSTLDTSAGAASRLGLTLRETPASVEVITQDTMQERGDRTVLDALRGAAGVSGGNPPSAPASLSMRGFNNVLFLYDGMRSSAAGITNRVEDTWNYERIEILKGPASVLNGDTAIGGIVNVVTRKPERNTSRELMLSYGSHGAYRAAVDLGGAIGANGAYRLDYSHNESKLGTVPNAGEKIDHLTGAVSFNLPQDVKLEVSLDYLKDNNQGYFGTPLVPRAFATEPSSVVSTPDGRVIDRRIAGNNYNVLDNENSSETYWGRVKLSGNLAPGWRWQNELAINQAHRLFKNAESAVFVSPESIVRDQTLITHEQHYVADRFDLSHQGSLAGLANRFVIGTELGKTGFDSERRFSDGSSATRALLTTSALAPQPGLFKPSPTLSTGAGNRTNTTTDINSAALFMEDALKLGSRFTLVSGLRYDHTGLDRSVRDLNTGSFSAFSTNLNATSARLGGVYDFDATSSAYAQYTTATLPVSTLFLYSAANTAFAPSRGKQAELGFKQSTQDARLSWTAAVYRIELDNVLSRDANNANLTVNNGKQSSQGLELTAAWRATRQWSLSGNAAILRARFDNLIEAGGVSRIGNVPTNVPERVYNLFSTWKPEALPTELFLGVNHTGASFTDTANQIRINGHTTADAGAAYRINNATITVRVRNLSNKLYADYGGRASSQVLLAPLRTVEIGARMDF